jgi:Helix-turn-helix domain
MMNEVLKLTPQNARPSVSGAASPKLLTAVAAALVLQMDHRTLIRWARARYVPAHPLREGRRRMWRFFEHELLAWVESQSNSRESTLRRVA